MGAWCHEIIEQFASLGTSPYLVIKIQKAFDTRISTTQYVVIKFLMNLINNQ